MRQRPPALLGLYALLAAMLLLPGLASSQAIIADHSVISDFENIPGAVIAQISANYRIYYGHTSHGSQIITGLDMVRSESALYDPPNFHEVEDDLGDAGDVSWVQPTRTYLNANPSCNVVMWSWCGGVTDNTVNGINTYLDAMTQLELDYPAVTFIYMTGHLDGTGTDGNLWARNDQIRAYCQTNEKVLFDFADIESYNPDGILYGDGSDACEWCYDWCSAHTCPTCADCAHSHCFNCYQKGKAFWWMMACLDGWIPTDVDQPGDESTLPAGYELKQNHPNPFNPATTITFTIPVRSQVTIEIYNLTGERVHTLLNEVRAAGEHEIIWEGTGADGEQLASGIYLYRMHTELFETSKKMILLK